MILRHAGASRRVTALHADGARVNEWLSRFDQVGRSAGGINRVAYSDADLAGRRFTQQLFADAGLATRVDAAGNIWARIDGSQRDATPIIIGSHVDSVTDGGNFDGPVGSFAAIEVARTLKERGEALQHPLDVVVWANEEGGTVGSKCAVGEVATVNLDAVARSGVSIREGIGRIGGDIARLETAVRRKGSVHCYLELHIEQGGTLERTGRDIGTVIGIVGLRWYTVTVTGFANHAGTTPMDQRQDALLAASKFAVALNETVRAEPGRQVVTVGRMIPSPNTQNVIPGRVETSIDLRDLDEAKLDRFAARFRQIASEIGQSTGTTFEFQELIRSKPAMSDDRLMAAIDASADSLGLSSQRMPSGAGHDAQELGLICPMAMIFVPSVGGISHSPREFTKAKDVANGVDVLLNAVRRADTL
ncbi:MAG: Zn-dependent hydrolase [Gemmatimonadaceae bacterium]|nr:Zn-dependent hydrolase [Gemmatimonadaceae bacterium]